MQLGAQLRSTLFSHPFTVAQDKNPGEKQAEATEKFKEVSEAYDVLTDPEKRKVGALGAANMRPCGWNDTSMCWRVGGSAVWRRYALKHEVACLKDIYTPPPTPPSTPVQIYDQFGEEGLKGGAPPPGTPGGGPEGFAGFGGGGGGGAGYQMDDETARRIFEGLFGGGLGGMFGGGLGGGGGGPGGPRVRIFQTGKKRGRPDFEGEGGRQEGWRRHGAGDGMAQQQAGPSRLPAIPPKPLGC